MAEKVLILQSEQSSNLQADCHLLIDWTGLLKHL